MTISHQSKYPPRLTRLEVERRARGLTQAQLAELAGCAAQTVGGVERSRLNPSSILLRSLAMALEFPGDATALLRNAPQSGRASITARELMGGATLIEVCARLQASYRSRTGGRLRVRRQHSAGCFGGPPEARDGVL